MQSNNTPSGLKPGNCTFLPSRLGECRKHPGETYYPLEARLRVLLAVGVRGGSEPCSGNACSLLLEDPCSLSHIHTTWTANKGFKKGEMKGLEPEGPIILSGPARQSGAESEECN